MADHVRCYLAVFFIAARITIPMRLTGTVLIDRPREEVARIVRLRPKGQTWQRNVERIEPHPDDPELMRAFLAPPISKHIPFFDVRILSDDGTGNQHWQATSDHKAWRGSECGMAMEDVGGRTLVTYAERSLVPVLGWLVAWLDDVGMDAMHELKFYVEGQPNWTHPRRRRALVAKLVPAPGMLRFSDPLAGGGNPCHPARLARQRDGPRENPFAQVPRGGRRDPGMHERHAFRSAPRAEDRWRGGPCCT